MAITVQLFGPQAMLVGERSVQIDPPSEPASAADVLRLIGEAAPELADSLATSRLAINHEFANDNDSVTSGDEVALIGLVSGG